MQVLPIASYQPGDMGDSGESGELVLKQLTCTNTDHLPTSCIGQPAGETLVKPSGAKGILKVSCLGNGNVNIGPSRMSSGVRSTLGSAGETACGGGGATFEFDYSNDVCIGTTGDDCVADIK